MSARLPCLVLAVFGVVLTRVASGDVLLRYVRPSARPWELAAGVSMVLVAGAAWLVGRSTSADASPVRKSRAGWLVLAPLVAIVVVTPPALGAMAAAGRPPAVPRQPGDPLPALPEKDPARLTVADLAIRSYWDAGRSVHGRVVRVIGMVSGRTPGGLLITRFAITCCAADAEPDSAEIRTTALPPPLRDGQWVEATGVFAGTSHLRRFTPILAKATVRPIAPPVDPYD